MNLEHDIKYQANIIIEITIHSPILANAISLSLLLATSPFLK